MALFIRQDEEQSHLRTKVASDLQARMKKTALRDLDDVSKNSTALDDQHRTKGFGVLVTIIVIVVVVVGFYLLRP